MKYCRTCVLPETRPNLVIETDGQCNACHSTHQKKMMVNWTEREKEFQELIKNVKNKAKTWDCVIPVSGGKDSTWQVIKALEYGLKPLCVTWKTPARNSIGQKNLSNLIGLGVDHIDFSINPEVEKKLTWTAFIDKGSLAIPMHLALFAIPLQVAQKFDIPLVLWGENSGIEYGGVKQSTLGCQMTREWLLTYGVTQGTTAQDWISDTLSQKDLLPYAWPSDEELRDKNVTAAFLGWYFPWDPVETYKVAQAHGFEGLNEAPLTGYYAFADVDDEFIISIHHWLKWYKFGFTRLWDNLSLEIRNERMTREKAIDIIAERGDECPKEAIERFAQWISKPQQEFFEVAEKFRNPTIWKQQDTQWQIPNFLIPGWRWS